MLWPASPEYVALCRSQAQFVLKSLSIDSFGVYLTEESRDRRSWLPVFLFPEQTEPSGDEPRFLPPGLPQSQSLPNPTPTPWPPAGALIAPSPPESTSQEVQPWPLAQPESEHLMLPLIYESLPLGVLVVRRKLGNWQAWEENQLQAVADTLAIGCVMDQRHQWLLHAQTAPFETQQTVLANLLHQFRNPLMALQTLTKLLLKRLTPPDHNRPVVESIWHESQRLTKLIEQFQDTLDSPPALIASSPGNLTLAAATLDLQPTNLADAIRPLLTAVQARAQELGIQVLCKWDKGLPPVQIEPTAFQEAVGNLLDNACKYTPAGGQIRIETRLLSPLAQGLLIADTGPGIPASDLSHWGERGYRGKQATGSIPGTGLGVAIAKHLIEEMQGTLTVQSPFPPNSERGTAVLITLPTRIVPPAPASPNS